MIEIHIICKGRSVTGQYLDLYFKYYTGIYFSLTSTPALWDDSSTRWSWSVPLAHEQGWYFLQNSAVMKFLEQFVKSPLWGLQAKGLGYLHQFLVFRRKGFFCQSAEGDFWTGGLSRWWMSLLTGRPFSMARFAQLESEQNKPTDWPNTNGPFKRSVSDLLTLVHKDLAAVMRTKSLKEEASSNWAGFHTTKGTRTRALTAFLLFGGSYFVWPCP